MRYDVESLLQFISLDKTKEEFGFPKNNQSKVICLCTDCSSEIHLTVLNLKNRFRKQKETKLILCEKCIGKRSWTPEKKTKIQKYWENKENKEKYSSLTKERFLNDIEFALKHKEACLASQSDEWRESLSLSSKNLWESEEYKNKQSEISKKLWESEEYRNRQFKTEEFKQRQSEVQRQIWKNPEYWINQSKVQKRVWENPEYKSRQSNLQKRVWGNHDKRQRQSELQKQVWKNPEYRSKITESIKKFWYNSAYSEKNKKHIEKVKLIRPLQSGRKLSTERITESVELRDFDFSQVKIKTIDSKVSSGFLNSFHYAGFGRSQKVSFGAFLLDDLIAVCKFSTVIREEVASSMDKLSKETMELDRFCIHPSFHKKNFASWFLSKSTKKFFDSFDKISCLVSFADLTYGHFGTIYKASNWKKLGVVKPDYCYVNDEGFILHKKTLYNRAVKMKMKEKEYAELHKYKKVFGKEKTKFILDRSTKS